MRKVVEEQMSLGEADISKIEFDLRSRDEIPQLLMGLQHIYVTPELRLQVFDLLEKHLKPKTKGRRGMDLWKVLVLGTLRLNNNWNYDKLKEMTDNHITIRKMLGHSIMDQDSHYPLQTLKDNVSLMTPELLMEINSIVVEAGHNLVKKDDEIHARCDSFVEETAVEYPTDYRLLFEACRCATREIKNLCKTLGIPGWRQTKSNIAKLKKYWIRIQKVRYSTSKDEEKRKIRQELLKTECRLYLQEAQKIIDKCNTTLPLIEKLDIAGSVGIEHYIKYANYHISLITRRVINEEKIPHDDKIFSIFKPHTEWICKGKAGVPQQLGLRICIMEDQYGFILGHKVMKQETDSDVCVSFLKEMKQNFVNITQCSFDQGFWSPENQKECENMHIQAVIPKKGRRSATDKEREENKDFQAARKQHAAVESGIGAIMNHGLTRCPDYSMKAFERYTAFGILGRNIQKLGAVIIEKINSKEKRSKAIKDGLARKKALQEAEKLLGNAA